MAETFSFDVLTADHDEVKEGRIDLHHSRVLISDEWTECEAACIAAAMAVIRHGGMPTTIMHRI